MEIKWTPGVRGLLVLKQSDGNQEGDHSDDKNGPDGFPSDECYSEHTPQGCREGILDPTGKNQENDKNDDGNPDHESMGDGIEHTYTSFPS